MTRQGIFKVGLILCAVILAAGVILGIKTTFGFAGYSYANAARYSSGEADISKPVNNLDIDWLDGKVSILYHGGNTVRISEKSGKEIQKDMQMRWLLDGDTLRIRYAKPGFRVRQLPQKELTVMLPESIVLGDATVHATSAAVSVPALRVDNLVLSVTSGDMVASVKAKTVFADTTSGDIDLQITDNAKEVSSFTTSGEINLTAGNVDRFYAETTSGGIHVTLKNAGDLEVSSTSGPVFAEILKARRAEIESTSGDIQISIAKLGSLKIKTTSGSVKASLPPKPGFKAELETTSGRVAYDLPLTKQKDSYVCGDGSGEVEIHTTSGNITVSEVK